MLRYWNWSLTAAFTPSLLKAVRDGDEDAADEYLNVTSASMFTLTKDRGA